MAGNGHLEIRAIRSPSYRTRAGVYRKIGKPAYIVRQGPFSGVRYVPFLRVNVPPKLLGTYELELHDIIEEICRSKVDRIINIGAAEGYYTVGFARRRPDVKIICFEMSEQVREDQGRLIRVNAVGDRVTVMGRCDPEDLSAALEGCSRPLVLCDVEGFELELLDLSRIPSLARAVILVELHEHERSGLTKTIRQRFEPTHDIQVARSRPRRHEDLPALVAALTDEEFQQATTEFRVVEQEWFYMVPRLCETER